jgi:hypothetical protein
MSKSLPSGVLGSTPEALDAVAEAGLILQLRGTIEEQECAVPPITTTEAEIDRVRRRQYRARCEVSGGGRFTEMARDKRNESQHRAHNRQVNR